MCHHKCTIVISFCSLKIQSIASPADSIDSVKLISNAANFARPDDWSWASKMAVASVTSQGTGGVIIAGFVRTSTDSLIYIYISGDAKKI